MILVIDNYDSFTYNLAQLLGELGEELVVCRNDKITLDEVTSLHPSGIVISPGPGTPADGGISNEVIRQFHRRVPILGVCLGHQCLAYSFGGKVVRAKRLMHGKTSLVHHDGKGVFADLPDPFEATRYHSLIVQEPVPPGFEVSAWTADGEIMGLRHRECPLEGVQFHPESILTAEGKKLLQNFIAVRPK
ncbi:aminodeoxychorismate/anthranilate synthase component II [Dehalococcoidia bacterium]|nr:aminodeoxychorismate/anthranilate synthase component II [Dehalococcoidia bacterium]